MGTLWTIKVPAASREAAEPAVRKAFARIAELNACLSDYLPESELSRLSATAGSGRPVAVRSRLLRPAPDCSISPSGPARLSGAARAVSRNSRNPTNCRQPGPPAAGNSSGSTMRSARPCSSVPA
jgi:hypothetical protein